MRLADIIKKLLDHVVKHPSDLTREVSYVDIVSWQDDIEIRGDVNGELSVEGCRATKPLDIMAPRDHGEA